VAQGELLRRGEERHRPLPGGLDDPSHGLGPLRLLQLGAIARGELLEALGIVSVPPAQLIGRGDLLAPLVEPGGVLAQPTGPEAVDEDSPAILGPGWVVDAPDLDRRGDLLTISRFDRRARLPMQMTMRWSWTVHESPLGPLSVVAGPAGIRSIWFPGEGPPLDPAAARPMPEAVSQLDGYFAGELRAFELDLELRGDPFRRLVWERLLEIPFGETTSYGALAQSIEESAYPPGLEPYRRPRLVGATIGRNPIPIVVPCHRVIGADGSLTGFRGGLERKRMLLGLEGWRPERSRAADSQLALL
jgi:methylated-DNA-[protein]-cysteine S-methyltransferase